VEAHHLGIDREATHPSGDSLVQGNHCSNHPVQLRRGLQIEYLAVGDEDLRDGGAPVGNQIGHAGVLDEGGVEVSVEVAIEHLETSLSRGLHPISTLWGVDQSIVTESIKLLGNREQIGLAAPQTEVIGCEEELHLVA